MVMSAFLWTWLKEGESEAPAKAVTVYHAPETGMVEEREVVTASLTIRDRRQLRALAGRRRVVAMEVAGYLRVPESGLHRFEGHCISRCKGLTSISRQGPLRGSIVIGQVLELIEIKERSANIVVKQKGMGKVVKRPPIRQQEWFQPRQQAKTRPLNFQIMVGLRRYDDRGPEVVQKVGDQKQRTSDPTLACVERLFSGSGPRRKHMDEKSNIG